jgi:hypothetical protein
MDYNISWKVDYFYWICCECTNQHATITANSASPPVRLYLQSWLLASLRVLQNTQQVLVSRKSNVFSLDLLCRASWVSLPSLSRVSLWCVSHMKRRSSLIDIGASVILASCNSIRIICWKGRSFRACRMLHWCTCGRTL